MSPKTGAQGDWQDALAKGATRILNETHDATEAYMYGLLSMCFGRASVVISAKPPSIRFTIALQGQNGKVIIATGKTLGDAARELMRGGAKKKRRKKA